MTPVFPKAPTIPVGAPQAADWSYLQLLTQLAENLQASQAALLSCEIARVEQLTAEQIALCNRLRAVVKRESRRTGDTSTDSVMRAEARLLHLSRVQHGLLQRARQRVRLVGHVLSGTHSSYTLTPQQGSLELRAFELQES